MSLSIVFLRRFTTVNMFGYQLIISKHIWKLRIPTYGIATGNMPSLTSSIQNVLQFYMAQYANFI